MGDIRLVVAAVGAACFMSLDAASQQCVGPFGPPGGSPFRATDAGRLWRVFGSTTVINRTTVIQSIGYEVQTPSGNITRGPFGNYTGPKFNFQVGGGDYINRVEVWAGSLVVRMKFTSKNGASGQFGGTGGTYHNAQVTGKRVVGFYGGVGTAMDRIAICFDYYPCTSRNVGSSGCSTMSLTTSNYVSGGAHRISLNLSGTTSGDPVFWAFGPPIPKVPLPVSKCFLLVNPLILARTAATGSSATLSFSVSGNLANQNIDAQAVRVATIIPTTFDASNAIRIECK